MKPLELQESFVRLLAEDAPPSWQKMFVHYENYRTADGELFEVSQSRVLVNDAEEHLELSLDAIDVLVAIRDELARSASSVWTWVEVTVESSGKFNFDFKYDIPPLTAQSLSRRPK